MADLTITAGSVVKGTGATTETLIAGASITAGQSLYKDASDSNKAKLFDADSATAAARSFYGVALNSASSGQPVVVQTGGNITIGATVAVGVAYYASDTPGGICPFADLEAGDYPTIIGIGISTTQIKIQPIAAGVTI
jgi:hypothetical protein